MGTTDTSNRNGNPKGKPVLDISKLPRFPRLKSVVVIPKVKPTKPLRSAMKRAMN